MSRFFARNISTAGRVVRGLLSLVFLGAAVWAYPQAGWLALPLLAAGAFGLLEALRGWCLLRACGIKTRL